jgi:hypothetical protein
MTSTPKTPPERDQSNRESSAACRQAAQSARSQIAHDLNQLLRRFRQYENEDAWVRLVMEGTGRSASEIALFAVHGLELHLRASLNCKIPRDLRLALKEAAAFEAVVRSKEAVTALRTNGEVGSDLSVQSGLAYLFPILNGTRVAAILFASADDADADLLELVANMAASALERQANNGMHAQISALPVLPALKPVTSSAPVRLSSWANLSKEERTLHSQAARFARITVAELELLKPAACRTARDKGDLYVLLNKEIDKAREIYRQRFMVLPSMTDYFHKELIESILGGDATKLGADYPGELA